MRLAHADPVGIDMLNEYLFLAGDKERQIELLQLKINNTKRDLLNLMRDLDRLKKRQRKSVISKDAMKSFFDSHPSMNLSFNDSLGQLCLSSKNQCVAFHTRRERNKVANNDDIIYVTLPLYGFSLEFHQDGIMRGCSVPSEEIDAAFGQNKIKYGHPHTTYGSRNYFGSVCNGNNRFIQDWYAMRNVGIMEGNSIMRLLFQAAIWMETANMSDMYGTSLAAGAGAFECNMGKALINDLFFGIIDASQAPEALRHIHDVYGFDIYRRSLWSLWLWEHFYDLPDCLNHCNSLFNALKIDSFIILKMPEIFGAIHNKAHLELYRTNPMAKACYAELGGYCPEIDTQDKTLAQLNPYLFGREIPLWSNN